MRRWRSLPRIARPFVCTRCTRLYPGPHDADDAEYGFMCYCGAEVAYGILDPRRRLRMPKPANDVHYNEEEQLCRKIARRRRPTRTR